MKRLNFESRADVVFLLVLAGIFIIIICAQELLPSSSLIPFATVNGRITRVSSRSSILTPYKAIEDRKITLKIVDKTVSYRTGDLGFSLNEEATLRPYKVESRVKRLIPFSMLSQMFRHQAPIYSSSQKGLNIVTSSIADGVYTDPVNAQIKVDQTSVTISPSQNGKKLDPKITALSIYDAVVAQKDYVELLTKTTEPDITTSELEKAVSIYSSRLPDSLQINIENKSQVLSKQTMLSWLTYEIKDSSPNLLFDATKITSYAESIVSTFTSESPPTPTIISLTDGVETGRIVGSPGKSIDTSDLEKQIYSAIEVRASAVTAKLVDVASPLKYTRSYTRSSAGLQELVDQLSEGKDIAISYADINERGWEVGSNSHKLLTMASTYKLFVGYSALKRVDDGSMHLADQVNGTTLDDCIQKMIVQSDNECAIALGEMIGWNAIVDDGKAIGANDLDWTDDAHGSVSDCAALLSALAKNDVLSGASRDYYLGLMKNQIYREGIPAGTQFVVADKVGFLGAQLNDAAIIYSPDLTHVLVIYTNGESWETIAEITRQIESLAL